MIGAKATRTRSMRRSSSWSATRAQVDHVKITRPGRGRLHVASLMATVGAHAPLQRLRCSPPAARWCATRSSCASPARARMPASAAPACSGRQHVDTTLVARSRGRPTARAASCSSPCSTTRAAACSRARSSCGRHAQKTDAKMATHALLLSDDGRSRQQAGARNLCRRRALRPRRDRRRSSTRI